MNLRQLLDGKKTYLVALAAILYVFGAHLGWWTYDDKILDALGFGGLITLRAGIKKSQDAAQAVEPLISANKNPNPDRSGDSSPLAVKNPPKLPLVAGLCFLCLLLITGCASVGSNPAADAQRIQRLATIAELAAFSGTQYWLSSHPADRQYFALSFAALDRKST